MGAIQTVREYLLTLGEVSQEEGLKLKTDVAVYTKLSEEMPRLFPAPDEIYTKSARVSDFDAVLVYVVEEGEEAEALRIILGLAFGTQEWEIEIDKCSDVVSLRALKFLGNYSVLLRIVGVNKKDYNYVIKHDTGTVLIGPTTCTKFVALDTKRIDVNPTIFLDRVRSSSYLNYIHAKQAHICALAAIGMPEDVPLPDEIVPALGMHFDIDFTYVTDTNGRLRREIDKSLGYSGWSGVIAKNSGQFSLHAIIPLKCDEYTLKIRVSILDACSRRERLLFVRELADRILYVATQPSDPDHKELIESATSK